MSDAVSTNQAQVAFWNSDNGRQWLESESMLDTLLRTALNEVMAAALPRRGESVLDIGCGTGASTIEVAGRISPEGAVLGVDVSAPLLARASARAAELSLTNIEFLEADAQTCAFQPAAYDLMISRMGVMFFDDPVAAFANLTRTLKPGGRMVFIAWSSLNRNPWFEIPRTRAVERLGAVPPADPTAPGPLAFQDIDRVEGLLRAAGLARVEGRSVDQVLTPPGTIRDAAALASRIGPAARIVRDWNGGDADVTEIEAAVAEAFAPFATDRGVQVPAVLNLFTAERPAST